jgi:hypothetical protein
MVKVHYDEGLTAHIGPESCVAAREGSGLSLAASTFLSAMPEQRHRLSIKRP